MGARILVIDDSSVVRADLRCAFEERGWTVSEAADGNAARMAMVAGTPPDVVVLDLTMPDPDGLALLRERDVGGAGTGLRVLVLSGRGSDEDEVLALRLGADCYCAKPYDIAALVAQVHWLLHATPAQVCAQRSEELGFAMIRSMQRAVTPPRTRYAPAGR